MQSKQVNIDEASNYISSVYNNNTIYFPNFKVFNILYSHQPNQLAIAQRDTFNYIQYLKHMTRWIKINNQYIYIYI